MIQKAVYFSILYLFISPVLINYGLLPNASKFLVEVLAIFFIIVTLISLAITKKFYAPFGYLVLIFLLFFVVGIGFIQNQLDASALILGLRHHFTYLPFFLLPLVYNFSEKEIKKILRLLCAILLFQAPIAFLQRFAMYSHLATGDVVRGTVTGSGTLSVILVTAISLCYTLFLGGHVKTRTFFFLSICFLFPTLINETKITFILIPIALAISTVLFDDKNIYLKFKKIVTYFLFTALSLSVFILAYNAFYGDSHAPVIDHLQKESLGQGYNYYGQDKAMERIEAGYSIGRIDTIVFAINDISQDLVNFFFGIGVGNAIRTKISFLKSEGADILKYYPDRTTIANILWELGFIGIFIHFLFLTFIFKDGLALRQQKNFIGTFCLGWCSVIGIRFITLFYHNILFMNAYDITFWLLSGIVISKSYQIKREIRPLHDHNAICQVVHKQSLSSPLDIKL